MSTSLIPSPAASLADRLFEVRGASESLVAPLEMEDFVVQSMPDVSPAKWHLAHTTWFFETFVLDRRLEGYRVFNRQYCYLFNSYYNSVGQRHPRAERGVLSRPAVPEILDYRGHVDEALRRLLAQPVSPDVEAVLEVGLHHEQQHQELLLTDLKHVFSRNPLWPAYRDQVGPFVDKPLRVDLDWEGHPGGIVEVGHAPENGFCFDNESPLHEVLLKPFQLANRLVTNGEYLEFIDDGGYQRPDLWLSDGWDTAVSNRWAAPLYWLRTPDGWKEFTLAGLRPLDLETPVTHVSLYEADAFARWKGSRLPTEFEWEVCADRPVPEEANFVESQAFHPLAPSPVEGEPSTPLQLFGDVWEWTASPYVAYPGYSPPVGALGEYNGKFMCNQFVLRGGSCATPRSHVRRSYRNFFHPEKRWQFTGIRLAR